MNTVFADSYFYLALLNARDAGHALAKETARSFMGRVITTQWVLVEVADALCGEVDRPKFIRLITSLKLQTNVTVVPADSALFDRGIDLFRSRLDKHWSLTDCLSFIVMNDYGLDEAFTADAHFEQAGFRALLRMT
jgi:predicted nucleic acid-binding protein